MKKILSLLFTIMFIGAFAQDDASEAVKPWNFSGLTSLNFNQSMFSNWASGGTPTLSGTFIGKYYGNYKKEKVSWNNNLNILFGLLKEQDEDLKKNEDLLSLNSIFGYEAAKKWQYSLLFSFNTQFVEGYDSDIDSLKISNFMAPAYMVISPGMKYAPSEFFYLQISPITLKSTFVMDQELANIGAFGVDAAVYDTATGLMITEGKNSLWRYGAFLEAYFKKNLAKGFDLESKFNIFYQYNHREHLETADGDVNWETFLNYKFNDWLAVSFFFHLAYLPTSTRIEQQMIGDEVTSVAIQNRQVQFKQTLGIGLSYTFGKVPE